MYITTFVFNPPKQNKFVLYFHKFPKSNFPTFDEKTTNLKFSYFGIVRFGMFFVYITVKRDDYMAVVRAHETVREVD